MVIYEDLVILNLHKVGLPPNDATIRGLFSSPDLLSFFIKLLKLAGYEFVTLRDAFETGGKRAVITFDDGYLDNYLAALPLLNSFQVPATIFVITGDVGKTQVVWNEAGEKLPSDMLDWRSLRQLHKSGWEIGSHSHAHIHHDQRSAGEQRAMILRSLDLIEENIGERPVSFAYPYGRYNADTKSIVRELGVKYAVTACMSNGKTDTIELPRVPFGGRRFYHYFKNLVRIKNVVGYRECANGVVMLGYAQFFEAISRALRADKKVVTANK